VSARRSDHSKLNATMLMEFSPLARVLQEKGSGYARLYVVTETTL